MTSNTKLNNLAWSTLSRDWNSNDFNHDDHLDHLLHVGLNLLNLDVAIISKISGNTYTVEHFAGGELQQGQQFDLGHTYCSITTKQKQLVSINHMGISEHFRHPCYEIFKLESYIGVPIILNGQQFGTLNFSSVTPREKPFTEDEQIFVRLIGETVNWALMAKYNTQ